MKSDLIKMKAGAIKKGALNMTNREKALVMGEPHYINRKRDKILTTSTNEIMAYKKKKGWTSDDPDLKELIEKYSNGSTAGGLVSLITDTFDPLMKHFIEGKPRKVK